MVGVRGPQDGDNSGLAGVVVVAGGGGGSNAKAANLRRVFTRSPANIGNGYFDEMCSRSRK